MLKEAIELLNQLGFSSYEAKAYIGMLGKQPIGAYELAKRSGIPTSKIYETMNKLLRRDVVQFSSEDCADNPTYVALPPEDLMTRINQQVSEQTSALLPQLKTLSEPETPDFIWPVTDLAGLKSKVRGLIQSAQKSVLISLWPEELEWLQAELTEAKRNQIDVAMVHFGKPEKSIGATYHHPAEHTIYEEKGGRGLTVVVDSNQVVIASLGGDRGFSACWSKNAAFVTVAEDYIKHDVYITKVTKHLGHEVIARYGDDFEKLRNIFSPEA